ncbi:MAG: DUF1295 domain-containing protein [Ferruginibacter sp.]
MSPLICLPLIALAIVCTIMLGAWIWGTTIRNYSVVDVFWAFNFAMIACFIFFTAPGNDTRVMIVCILAFLWSLRLGIHLSKRIFPHLDEEEGRYKQLRKDWQKNIHLKFFFFFQMQAFSNVWLALPFFIIACNTAGEICWLEYAGAGIWLISIIGEAIADRQLDQFKKDPVNKGKVCDKGLWNYSRHPNYFFQLMIWIGVFIFAVCSPYGWLAVISPLTIAYLLFKVTGIPMTEEQSLRSKGEKYKAYQRSTSVFVPWFKKK